MRVAYVCTDPGVPVFGSKGCSVHVQAYLRALMQRGSEVTLFARQVGDHVPAEFSSLRVLRLPMPFVTEAADKEQALLANDPELAFALSATGPFDLVYERHALWSHAAMTFARTAGVPGVLEVNAPLVDEQERHRVLVDREGAERTAREAFRAAKRIVAVSEKVAAGMRKEPDLAAKTMVVSNGVDADRFRPEIEHREPERPFTVGFVGSLKPWHGLDDLIRAFKSVNDRFASVRLLIVGDGPEREAVETAVQRFELDTRVTITGAVPHEDVPRWIARMDVAVAPYPSAIDCYFSPLKLYEYMACGVPVVASDTGQISETITHGVNGLLYQPGNLEALVQAILVLKEDPALASSLGHAARSDVVTKHTWAAGLDRVLESLELPIRKSAEVL